MIGYKYGSFKESNLTYKLLEDNELYFSLPTDPSNYLDTYGNPCKNSLNEYGINSMSNSQYNKYLWDTPKRFGNLNTGFCLGVDLKRIKYCFPYIFFDEVDYGVSNSNKNCIFKILKEEFQKEKEVRVVGKPKETIELKENMIVALYLGCCFGGMYNIHNLDLFKTLDRFKANNPKVTIFKLNEEHKISKNWDYEEEKKEFYENKDRINSAPPKIKL